MKFGKEFAAQMVPEWQQAYMDYNYLKTILKDILHMKRQNRVGTPDNRGSRAPYKRRASLYRAFSGLTGRHKGSPRKDEEEVILVSEVQGQGNGTQGFYYQTMFLMSSDDGGESEMLFFRSLDYELNKVIGFYKKKVEEVLVEADKLSEQMDTLIALRIKVDHPLVVVGGGESLPSSAAKSRNTVWSRMSVIPEVELSSEEHSDEEKKELTEEKKTTDHKNANRGQVPSLRALDHVKINVDTEASAFISAKSDLPFSKPELRKAEEKMRQAFVEFYHQLKLLKGYSFMNQLAFSKIMKKYDKITSRKASKAYLETVENSYLGRCDEVTKLMERVEATFVKHFSNGNHRKGMTALRQQTKKEKHRITFFLGLFTGCSLALMVAIGVLVQARGILKSEGTTQYMDNIFPLYSLFGFIVLHMIMYSGNIYFWKRYRVNYPFIFGFKEGTELGYREVLLLSSGLAVLTLAGIISNLDMEMDPRTRSFEVITELVPLGVVTVVFLITFCPFNIIYRSSRFFLIQCTFHCLCAPLYKVILPDFFLADQLTSQVQAFRSLEFYVCYYGWGDFKRRSNTCSQSEIFEIFHFIVAVVPYWFRFLQCLRRLFEEKGYSHGFNALKYLSTIIAVVMKTSYELNRTSMTLKIIAAATSGIATIYNTYWDIVVDWGLLRINSSNPGLRDKLVIPSRSVYFIAMVLNVLLRLAWMQTVLDFTEAPFLHGRALIAIVASLEIIRRGIWNFFRLENEHLNNVGKYRAFKSVPLPFSCGYNGNKGL